MAFATHPTLAMVIRRDFKKGYADKAKETEGVTYCPGGF